jgi:hypothetical protein
MAQVAMLSALMAMETISPARLCPVAVPAPATHERDRRSSGAAAGMLEQQPPGAGGLDGARALHQHRAHLSLQRTQALGHRRLGDVQLLRGALEAAFFHDGGQAFQCNRVPGAHGNSLAFLMKLLKI